MTDDREPFEQARAAGLRARHETREARAIRKQVAEEIAQAIEVEESWKPDCSCPECHIAARHARIAREIGTKEASP